MGFGWRQPDPGYWMVRALEVLGLVRDVRTEEHLPLRPGARPASPREAARRAPCFGPRAASRC
ncbi:hypothetical protein P2318_24280 [Myxococcaceae bacterium GXIMD 01537]